jgi:hypothetical protein
MLRDSSQATSRAPDSGSEPTRAACNLVAMRAAQAEDLRVRPNTGLPAEFMQRDMIICSGEDPGELKEAIASVFGRRRRRVHEYRNYRAWRFTDPPITIILSGIGTGCLEPLLFEILDKSHLGPQVPRRLVMIGTAGYRGAGELGQVFLVDGAYTVGCAVALEDQNLPVRPSFARLDRVDLPRAEELSTDYYYAATENPKDERKARAQKLNPALREGLSKYWTKAELISMESAQFYHFASVYGPDGTEYVALRGVANRADEFETQAGYSRQVLVDALGQARALLST